MKAVTAGLFGDYHALAEEAAYRFREHTGLETVILNEDHLREFSGHPIMTEAAADQRDRVMFLKLFLFDLLPDEDIVWFDADYSCIAPWNPADGYDGTFTAVRDRTGYLFEADDIRSSSAANYFNAGFFIANRHHHALLFRWCQDEWRNVEWKWHVQCLLNAAMERPGTEVRYLDRRHNCLNFGPAFQRSDVRAVHCSSNYNRYREGSHLPPGHTHVWSPAAMKELSGFYNCEYGDGWASLALLYDGTTSEGGIWFAGEDRKIFFADIYGNDIPQPAWMRRTG